MNGDQAALVAGLVIAPTPHYCRPPLVERWVTPPKFDHDEPDMEPCRYEEVPTAGSVWRCSCGSCWEAREKRQYVSLISFGNEWVRISAWRYGRRVRRLAKQAGDQSHE